MTVCLSLLRCRRGDHLASSRLGGGGVLFLLGGRGLRGGGGAILLRIRLGGERLARLQLVLRRIGNDAASRQRLEKLLRVGQVRVIRRLLRAWVGAVVALG